MYAALIVLSVPMPLVAAIPDRVGRKPVIGVYVSGAISFLAFLLADPDRGLWSGSC
jgi:MFS family permease